MKLRLNETSRFVLGGLLAGTVMGIYLAIVSWLNGKGLAAPLMIIGRTLEPSRVPFELNAGLVLLTGMLLHGATSVFWALRYQTANGLFPLLSRNWLAASVGGILFGMAVWFLMGLVVGPSLNPKMRIAYPIHYLIGHILYGCALALLLCGCRPREEGERRE